MVVTWRLRDDCMTIACKDPILAATRIIPEAMGMLDIRGAVASRMITRRLRRKSHRYATRTCTLHMHMYGPPHTSAIGAVAILSRTSRNSACETEPAPARV